MNGIIIPHAGNDVKAESFFVGRQRWTQKLLTDPQTKLPAATRDIGVLLATMCSADRPFAFPSNRWLAQQTSHSVSSIERATARLRRLGYIRVQSGGIDPVTSQTYCSRYFPLFDKADRFRLGAADFVTHAATDSVTHAATVPSQQRDSTLTSDGSVPSPVRDESGRMSAAPPRLEGAAATQDVSSDRRGSSFERFWNLATEYGKVGSAGYQATLEAYKAALTYPGVTDELLLATYRGHLEKRKNHPRYTGDYAVKFLRNPRNYTGLIDAPERIAKRPNGGQRSESLRRPSKQSYRDAGQHDDETDADFETRQQRKNREHEEQCKQEIAEALGVTLDVLQARLEKRVNPQARRVDKYIDLFLGAVQETLEDRGEECSWETVMREWGSWAEEWETWE